MSAALSDAELPCKPSLDDGEGDEPSPNLDASAMLVLADRLLLWRTPGDSSPPAETPVAPVWTATARGREEPGEGDCKGRGNGE
jgi:hypothetical protein